MVVCFVFYEQILNRAFRIVMCIYLINLNELLLFVMTMDFLMPSLSVLVLTRFLKSKSVLVTHF